MKTYLQYIKEGSEEFYKEILELYEKMPPKKGDPSTITAEEIIDFLKRYIDKEFKINSKVIYPPVDVENFERGKGENGNQRRVEEESDRGD